MVRGSLFRYGLAALLILALGVFMLGSDHDEARAGIAPQSGSIESCAVNRVVDGDGIRLNCGPDRKNLNVRLHCIDAPESDQQPWAAHATAHLQSLVAPHVDLWSIELDRYGRTVGRIYRDGEDLNLRMVADGRVAVYPQFCDDRRYYKAERIARDAGVGIWSQPGMHQQPWEWRRNR